jgi:hypothetical protein
LPHWQPDAPLFKEPHHPSRRVEAEGASSGEENGMDTFRHMA